MSVKSFIIIACLSLLPCAAAGTWEDFINNLSTDLAPLISLFGETVTKQWLSESLTVWDNLLFAMGPLGVLTAIVSAIRVAGSPSLKAFIGRAQESPGTAELELLSCTSGTTAELWNEGGIARVFGRPHILEVVRRTNLDRPIELIDESAAWFVESSDAVHSKPAEKTKPAALKSETPPTNLDLERGGLSIGVTEVKMDLTDEEDERSEDLGSPNLSLNIGIHRKSKSWFRAAALAGVLLQSGVLVFGALSVYQYATTFPLSPKTLITTSEANGFISAPRWAFPTMFCGTILLCFGMFLCAYIIERSTNETYFRKKCPPAANEKLSPIAKTPSSLGSSPPPSGEEDDGDIYWIQMGGQNIGDQVFNAFIAKHPKSQDYIRSQKRQEINLYETGLLWFTLAVTLSGFVMQFIGLRYLHPSIALAQLGVTILMSIIRSTLRTQRLSMDGNLIPGRKSKRIHGHELDFFSLYLETKHTDAHKVFKTGKDRTKFSVCLEISRVHRGPTTSKVNQIFNIRTRLARLTSASVLVKSPVHDLTRSLEWTDFEVRTTARVLQSAIEGVMKEIYKNPNRKDRLNSDHKFCWTIKAEVVYDKVGGDVVRTIPILGVNAHFSQETKQTEDGDLRIMLTRESRANGVNDAKTPWKIDCHELEAILGLWSWSKPSLPTPFSRALAFFENEDERTIGSKELEIWAPFENQSLEKVLYTHTGSNSSVLYGFQPPGNKPLHLAVSTKSSKILMCAQDLFMAFLLQAADELIDKFGGQTTFSPARDNEGDFQLTNSHLDAMAARYEESGLGSSDDAYACIFSTLRLVNKEPLIEDSYESMRNTVEALPNTIAGFEQAQTLLKWIEMHCRPENKRAAIMDLGELYRKAIVYDKKDADLQKLGFDGLLSLLLRKDKYLSDVAAVILSYAWIGRQIAIDQKQTVLVETFSELSLLDGIPGPFERFDQDGSLDPKQVAESFLECDSAVMKYLFGTPGNRLDINLQDARGRGALSCAAELNPELGLWLLKQPGINQAKDYVIPLIYAAEYGKLELVEMLLQTDCSHINKVDAIGKSSLMYASEFGHEAVVRILLNDKYGVISSAGDNAMNTALHYAVKSNDFSITCLLVDLRQRIDINAFDKEGYTALFYAATNGNIPIVEYLISHGAICSYSEGAHRWSALVPAARGGHIEMVKLLFPNVVANPANPDQPLDYSEIEKASHGPTALYEAAANGHLDIVKFFLSQGANINSLDDNGSTPISVAAAGGHAAVVELLCEKDAIFEISGLYAGLYPVRSALLWAVSIGHEGIVKLLLSKGAKIDNGRYSVLPEAAGSGQLELVKLLLHAGADVESLSIYGSNALCNAISSGHLKVVELLVAEHATLGPSYASSNYPLGIAAGGNQVEIVRFLLSIGAFKEEPNFTRQSSALRRAASNGHAKVVELLLDHGADPNELCDPEDGYYHCGVLEIAMGGSGYSCAIVLLNRGANPNGLGDKSNGRSIIPLIHAVCYNKREVLKLLIVKGANLEVRDYNGMTALDMAIDRGYSELERLLLEGGAIDPRHSLG